jgi:DNA-binding MarR family transcriptional regulator
LLVYDGKIIDSSLRSLVKKGYVEQYTDTDGGFSFAVTEEGKKAYSSLDDNPESIFDIFGNSNGSSS